ncbi:MAG: Flp pilus assembly complex ATPase component TadA [Lachnospiraceae bacterium]|nr:Flp pilus assembly complex ATPase component TadA [Candidatus Colinaster scatohippi]
MELRRKKRLGDILIDGGAITQEQLSQALAKQKELGLKLGATLVQTGIATEEAIAHALSNQLGYDLVDLAEIELDESMKNLVDEKILKKYSVIPFEIPSDSPNTLRVAMADPMDMAAIDDISIITNLIVEPYVATPKSIAMAIDRFFGQTELESQLDEYTRGKEQQEMEETDDMYSEDVNNSPIVQLVKSMIETAVRKRTSDIHIEPMEKQVRIRYRIDGALYEQKTYSPKILPALVARIKIIGGMDIAEKRKPQDGRITQIVDRMEYDIRVSILPTVYGEKIVMRLTSKTALTKAKKDLGLSESELKVFDHIISNPHGILLVTGPTGSGKSTTLYTALSELNKEDVNIITVEDPVEANIDGINQVQTNNKANLTFASALRSILRQDPDIIMIGEIRDGETAGIAVQASITGHLVVSTLHTNSAASTITRLADMGIEPYLIADSTIGIIAQRLVRRLCPTCKIEYTPDEEECDILGIDKANPIKIYKPCGCKNCDNSGYKGRIGVYEIMEVTHDLKLVIARGGTADEIKNQALKEGMNTLRMSATRYVLEGITSVTEMRKVSFDS